VRDRFVEACAFQDIPFEEMACRLSSDSKIQKEDLAQVFFLLSEEDQSMPPLPGLRVDDVAVFQDRDFFQRALHNYDLLLYLQKAADGIKGQLTVRKPVLEGNIGRELVEAYKLLLQELINSH
jgi:hypothetical protein